MTTNDWLSKTVLSAFGTGVALPDLDRLSRQTEEVPLHSVILNGYQMTHRSRLFPGKEASLMISHPFGGQTTAVKTRMIREAAENHCTTAYAAPQFSLVKSGEWESLKQELTALREAAGGTVKVTAVVFLPQLTGEEISGLCRTLLDAGISAILADALRDIPRTDIEYIRFIRRGFRNLLEIELTGSPVDADDAQTYLKAGVARFVVSQEELMNRLGRRKNHG